MNLSDLYKSARDGEPKAEATLFEQLLVRFRYLVNSKVQNRQDGEEIVQAAMLVIAKEYRSLTAEQRFEAWAYKVLNFRILGLTKATRRSNNRTADLDEEVTATVNANPDDQLRERLLDCLFKIRKANPMYARILTLHFQGHSTDEICSKLDITPNNLYVSLSRARGMLRHCLDGNDG